MNENKANNIRLVADIIAPAAVISVTVALFLLFIPEEAGALFWTIWPIQFFLSLYFWLI